MSELRTRERLREQRLREAMGTIGENFPRNAMVSASVSVSGTVYYSLEYLFAGEVVTNIQVDVNAIPVAATLTKVAMFTTANAQLGVSTDRSADLASTGPKNLPLITPVPAPVDAAYWFAFVNVAGTGASLGRNLAGLTNTLTGPFGAALAPCGVQTGQADMPATATIAVGSGSPILYWMGWS